MTSFLTGGLGSLNSSSTSRESRSLDSTKVGGKSFANKDFEKNIAFLNQSVDTHTAFLQKLQSGVDQANENVLEQVQGFWGDLFTLFAGLTPTGVELGDIKYVIQGIGAFFGINPETPFPLNLFEAALHFLTTYIIPLDQFTDVIFDAILAWAVELGLSQSFIDSIKELMEAVSMLGETFFSLFDSLGELLSAFGFLNWTSTSGLGELWDTLVNLIDGLALEPLKPVLALLADLGIPFINALTAIISGATSFLIPFTQIIKGSPNVLVSPGFTDNDSFVNAQGWTRDAFVGRTFEGSAKATAAGIVRELISDPPIAVDDGQKIEQEVYVSWSGASYTGTNHAQLTIRAYSGTTGQTLVSQTVMQAITFTGTVQAAWQKLSGTYTVPAGVTFVRIALKVGSNVATGNVWFDDASAKRNGGYLGDLFGGITSLFGLGFLDNLIGVNPFEIWTNVITGKLNPLELLEDFGIRGLVQNLLDAMISVIRGIPFVGGFLATLVEDLTGWFEDTEHTAGIAADAKMGVQATQNILESKTTNSETTTATDESVAVALEGQTNTIIANVAAITALQQVQLGNNNSGISALEAFEYLNATDLDPGLWSVSATEGALTGAKIAVADGHNAGMVNLAGGNVTQMCRYIGPNNHTLTDYQKNTVVVAAAMDSQGFFDGRVPSTDVYARISDDETKWVRYRWFTNGIIRFEYKNDGAITQLGADLNTGMKPPAGSQLSIEAGVGLSPRSFRLGYNSNFYLPISDAGNVTALGDTARGAGWGQRVENGLMPGLITQFSMADNKPAETRGVGFRAYRSLTTGITKTPGEGMLPTGTFDVVDRITSDMSWDGQALTISIEGWYIFPIRIKTGLKPTNNTQWNVSIYRGNGSATPVIAARSWAFVYDDTAGSNGGGANPNNVFLGGDSAPLYCVPGDKIRVGGLMNGPNVFDTYLSNTIIGDAGGLETWFCAILLNRSLA